MKAIRILVSAFVIVLVSAVSFCLGREYEIKHFGKADYQAACILNECCLNMINNIGTDAEEIYYEYMDNLDCYGDIIITKEDIQTYRWSFRK